MKSRAKRRQGPAPGSGRSPKAGKPRQEIAGSSPVRRRRKTAIAAVRKDTMLSQAAQGPRVLWGVTKPKVKKG